MPSVELDYSLSPLDALASTSRRERSDSIRRQRRDPGRPAASQNHQDGQYAGEEAYREELTTGARGDSRIMRGASSNSTRRRNEASTSRPPSPPSRTPSARQSPRSDLHTSPIISRHAFSNSTPSLSVDQDQQSIYSDMQDSTDLHHSDLFVSPPKNNPFQPNSSPQLLSVERQSTSLSSKRVERELAMPALRRNPSVRGYPTTYDLTPNAETESLAADRSTWYSMNGEKGDHGEEGAKMEAERIESNRFEKDQYEDAESPELAQFEPIRSPLPHFDQQFRSPSTETFYNESQQPTYSPVASPSRPSRARSLTQSKNFSRPSAPVISSVLYEEEERVTSSQGYESTIGSSSRSTSGQGRPLQIQTNQSHKQYHADSLASPTFLGSFNRPLPPSPTSTSNRYQPDSSQPTSPSSFSPSQTLQSTPVRSSSLQSSPRRSLSNSISRSFKGEDSPKATGSLSRSGSASVSRSGSKKKAGWAAFFGGSSKGEKEQERRDEMEERNRIPPPSITLSRQNSGPNIYDQNRRDSVERMNLRPSVAKAVASRFVPNGKASPTEWTTSRVVAEEEEVILQIGMGRMQLPQRSISDNGPRQHTDSVFSNYSIYSLPPDDSSRLNSSQPRSPLSSSFPTTITQISPSPSQQSVEPSHTTHHSTSSTATISKAKLSIPHRPVKLSRTKSGRDGPPANPVDAEDYLQLGIIYHEAGEMERAAWCFEKSATVGKGCGSGFLLWGLTLRHGWGCQENPKLGFRFLQCAAESVVQDLDRVIVGGRALSEDEMGTKAVKNELVLALHELGQSYRFGWGCEQDKAMAVSYFELAANLGDPDAQLDLAHCCANGKGCKKDMKKAAKYYRMAMAQGVESFGLSWCYKPKYLD